MNVSKELRFLLPERREKEGQGLKLLFSLLGQEGFCGKAEQIARVVFEKMHQARNTGAYRAFDALLRNDGCQITACRVMQLMITPDEKQLMRFCFLCIVNCNVLNNNREISKTNVDSIRELIDTALTPKEMRGIEAWVRALQQDEARSAVEYIRNCAENELPEHEELRKALQIEYVHAQDIVSIALLSSMEAIWHLACKREQIILLCNKLFLAGKPIQEVEPQECYVRACEECILSKEEIENLHEAHPILVIEAYVQKGICLKQRVQEVGLLAIFLANAASCPQFVGKRDAQKRSPLVEEIEIEHVFCASRKELRGVS